MILANQSSGSLMLDIVNEFARSGKYERTMLFAGEINIRPTVPDESVIIKKTIKYNRKNTLTRFFTWFIAFFHLLVLLVFKNKKHEIFLVSNPPLNVFIPFFVRNDFSLLIYDVYPDTFVAQRVFSKNSFIVKQWEKANQRVFSKALQVFTISNDMKAVLTKYVASEKIQVVYNWIHPIKFVPKEQNSFLEQHGLTDKFIVLYSGNMGVTHDLDVMVDVANILKNQKDIMFVFIGEGGKKKTIMQKIEKFGLKNCIVLPYQPNEMLSQTMGSASLGIVTLDSGSASLSIPSKTNRFLALGVPTLCIANKNVELSTIIEKNEVGKSFQKNALDKMANFILALNKDIDLQHKYKENALKLSKNFSPENAELFLNHLR